MTHRDVQMMRVMTSCIECCSLAFWLDIFTEPSKFSMFVVRPRYNASNLGFSRAVPRSRGGTIAITLKPSAHQVM